MAKPKPSEKIVLITFKATEKEKEQYNAYASELGFPLSRVIRDMLNKAIYSKDIPEKNPISSFLQDEISELKAELRATTEEYMNMIKKSQPEIKNVDENEGKGHILLFLTEMGELSLEKLESYTKIPKTQLRKLLVEMKENGTIDFNAISMTWGLK